MMKNTSMFEFRRNNTRNRSQYSEILFIAEELGMGLSIQNKKEQSISVLLGRQAKCSNRRLYKYGW